MSEFKEKNPRRIVSVVIPVLNESATIASMVRLAKRSPVVDEVLVVDDGSIDGTPELALRAGARVVTSTMLGKGASMQDGLQEARNDIVAYLDGDMKGLGRDTLSRLCEPIIEDRADFTKAKFKRKAGRVTILTAKPLLRSYFPELADLDQPLGGVIAARRDLLEKMRFENDYGVDVGLLIDAFRHQARIVETDIGSIKHRSQDLNALGEMATQVARTIFERAASCGRLRLSFIRETKENERLRRLRQDGYMGCAPASSKLALFDMDGVLLNGRFIVSLAQETHRESDLSALLDNYTLLPKARMKQIAAVFSGVRRSTFEQVAKEIPLMPGAVDTVVSLRRAGYQVGIVTDSYNCVAEIVRRRVFADFSFSHFMRFKSGRASGRVNLCPAMIHPHGCQRHDHCKANVLMHLSERFGIDPAKIVAVGDGENDICMLQAAGCSVAFRPKTPMVEAAARHTTSCLTDVCALAAHRDDSSMAFESDLLLRPLFSN